MVYQIEQRLSDARNALANAIARNLPENDTWEENGLGYYRHQVESLESVLSEAKAREDQSVAHMHGVSVVQSILNPNLMLQGD